MKISEYQTNCHAEAVRIANAKTAIATAIEGKGVTVPEGTKLDGLAALVESIEAGGGLPSGISQIEYGTFTPTVDDTSASFALNSSFVYDISIMTATDEDIYTDVSGSFTKSLFLAGIRFNLPYTVGTHKIANSVQYRLKTGTEVSTENQALTSKHSNEVIPYSQKYLIAGHTYKWIAIKFV